MYGGNGVNSGFNSPYYEASATQSASNWKIYGCVIAIIVAIGGAAMVGVGVASYFQVGALSHMAQVHAILLMTCGSIVCIAGLIGAVKYGKSISAARLFSNSSVNITSPSMILQTLGTMLGRQGYARFGKEQWETYLVNDVGVEPPLPENIDEILNSVCPFKKTKVKDTHMLVLIPETVDGKNLNLDVFGELIKMPKKGNRAFYKNPAANIGRGEELKGIEQSYWVLMPKEAMPESLGASFLTQKELLQQYKPLDYVLPTCLEVAVCVMTQFISTGWRMCHSDTNMHYIRCTEFEQSKDGRYYYTGLIGNLTPDGGLELTWDSGNDLSPYGITPVRRFPQGVA